MSHKEIKKYKLSWDIENNTGTILVKFTQGNKKFTFDSSQNFLAASSIIQHEAPVYFDETNKVFFCGAEDVDD